MKKTFFLTVTFFSVILLSTTFQSCYYDNEEVLYGASSSSCDTASIKFASYIQPLVAAKCATSGCHNAASASAGVNLSSYANIKTYITNDKESFIGSIKQTSGFSAMPKGGSKMATCDISKIEAWIAAGTLNN